MKTRFSFPGMLSLLFVIAFCTGSYAADEARLFDAKDFIPQSKEKGVLYASETRALESLRGRPKEFAYVIAVSINSNALQGNTITLVMPDSKEYQFIRSTPVSVKGVWVGQTKKREMLVMSESYAGVYGEIRVDGKMLRLQAMPGKRYYTLAEVIRRPMREPEDKEPPPARQGQ